MKNKLFFVVTILFINLNLIAQSSSLDTWTIGVGATNAIMHGDLTSLNSEKSEFLNVGYYLYINKMISPAFGFELKGQLLTLSGASQSPTSDYNILYAPVGSNSFYFEGETFGGELNAVINLNGLAKNINPRRKLNFSAYLGIGLHSYDSKLFDLDTDELLIDFENASSGNAKSIYYTTGLGLRYKLSQRFDLELRQTVNFNNEDNLDAAISQQQSFETFFNTSLGLVFKLSKKGNESIVWQDTTEDTETPEIVEKEEVNLTDTDGDGVIDQLDKEPNTPKGAVTYGNGVAIDTDKDGIIDFKDKCPLKAGEAALDGCPVEKDTDGDGVVDSDDLCPKISGPIDNRGCPIAENKITEVEKRTILNLAKNIYFQSGKSDLRDSSKRELAKIADIMLKYPDIRFIIEGHTDSGGKRVYNLRLSQARADAVKKHLTSLGVAVTNLDAIGYGFAKPKYTNRTSGGRQLNRRVEIKVEDELNSSEASNSDHEGVEMKHTIKRKETLYSISNLYNVTVDQLKEWNHLTSNNIIVGEQLIIKR